MEINCSITVFEESQYEELFPKRSEFYGLEPMGKGTAYSECLTSYMCRLAYSHNIKVSTLIKSKIYPNLNISPSVTKKHESKIKKLIDGKYVNGIGVTTREYIRVLETLTQRNDLNGLTMLNWSAILNRVFLINENKRWCPVCLSRWKDKKQVIYEPLIWCLKALSICNIHKIKLQEECSNCKQIVPHLTGDMQPGYCPSCKEFLGNNDLSQKIINKKIIELEEKVFNSYSQLISSNFSTPVTPLRNSVSHFFNRIMNENSKISIANFARQLSYNRTRVNNWFHYGILPPMQFWGQICEILDVPLNVLLIENVDLGRLQPLLQKRKYEHKETKQLTKKELNILESVFLNHLNNEKVELSFKEIAEINGYSQRRLQYHFPRLKSTIDERHKIYKEQKRRDSLEKQIKEIILEKNKSHLGLKATLKLVNISAPTARNLLPDLCDEIVLKHQLYLKEQKENRIRRQKEEIRKVIIELHNQGIVPTNHMIQKYSSKPITFINEITSEYCCEVRKELGY
ncbi:TniQ family protein [Bacillus paranthracis]|uniref:TniQ family protein n=1 Tax=Bacillus paranthracis TaxID=2026186 RepID=UPI00397FECDF